MPHPHNMPCETAVVPQDSDGRNGGGGGGGDGGSDPPPTDPPNPSPNISGPTIENVQTIQEQAQLTYSVENTGDAPGSITVVGTIDLGNTGTIDAEQEERINLDARDVKFRAFEFLPTLNGDTDATICVKEA